MPAIRRWGIVGGCGSVLTSAHPACLNVALTTCQEKVNQLLLVSRLLAELLLHLHKLIPTAGEP